MRTWTMSPGDRPRLTRRRVLGLAGGALVLGLDGRQDAWGQGGVPAITVYKSPT